MFNLQLNTSTSVEFVKVLDAMGQIKRKLSRAVLKDTVTVPDGGYTITHSAIANLILFWISCLDPLVYMHPKIIKLFVFPIF
jgi:hypothetical protein